MAPLYDGHDYYKKMFELQEKLRKSEEDRIRLEERFNTLLRESRNRHEVCLNRLRMRYVQYLEEQRTRDERNHKLLTALDKVMNKLALISAKKDRLNVLRKQYEAYLLRVYANRQPPGSVTGDSGIASQNEDRYPRKTVVIAHSDLASADTRDISSPRIYPASPQSNQSRSTSASKFHDQNPINSTLLNNLATLPTTPLDISSGDYHQTNVLRRPHIYALSTDRPGDRLVQVPAIATPDVNQYPRIISGYDENVPRNFKDTSNLDAPRMAAPALSKATLEQAHSDAVNRFLRQHVESVKAAPSLSTARFPAGDAARYENAVSNVQQFNPLAFQHHDTNVLLSNLQSRIREHDLLNAAVAKSSPVIANSNAYLTSTNPEMNVSQIKLLPGYMDYTLRSPQKSEDEGSTRSLTSDDVDDLIRRNEHLLWRNADVAKAPQRLSSTLGTSDVILDENGRTTALLENELDRYISNIRKLHREHGMTSQEEMDHEQNTSGDLLNVTLSEDALELPAEADKARRERVSEDMDRVLALADDLASRTAETKKIMHPSEQNNSDRSPAEIGDRVKQRATSNGTSGLEETRDTPADDTKERGASAKNEIREDVATRSTELEQPHKDAALAKENWNNASDLAESRKHEREASITKRDDTKEKISEFLKNESSLQIDNQRNAPKEEPLELVIGEESDIEGLLDTTEELAPWDLESVQKRVRELRLDDLEDDRTVERKLEEAAADRIGEKTANEPRDSSQVVEQRNAAEKAGDLDLPQDTLPLSETRKSDASEAKSREKNEVRARVEETENVPSEITKEDQQESKVNEPIDIAPQTEEKPGKRGESDGEKQDSDRILEMPNDQLESAKRDNEYNVEQEYVEDTGQSKDYEQQDPNQQYYDQNAPYEAQAGDEEYGRYANQGYAQNGQEYVEYVDGQYEQYAQDPNNQQYQHDPNAQYEQDSNQAYGYNYDQQYDPNQGYEGDPNQYEYAESAAYDPNQIYDAVYEQEYKEEQQNPNDDVVNVESVQEERPETEETSLQRQADPESQYEDEDKPQQADFTETKKKKKDVIKSLLDSDTDTTIERNVSQTESDFDFN